MHEHAVVAGLIDALSAQLAAQGIDRVAEVRVRRNSAFAAEPMKMAFQMLSPNTPLDGAALVVEEVSFRHICANGQCGYRQVVTADDLIGHLYICPECGTAEEIDEAHGIEVLSVTVNDTVIPVAVHPHPHEH
jgi:Zn finger protein HypA/HybF involved in hydrogenase expression